MTKFRLEGIEVQLFLAFLLYIIVGSATVSISGQFYNSLDSLSLSETVNNANSVGNVCLLPSGDNHIYSIDASESGTSNIPNGTFTNAAVKTERDLSLVASTQGNKVVSKSVLNADAGILPFIRESWSYGVTLGLIGDNSAGSVSNQINQMIDIRSIPGVWTYVTSGNIYPTVTTGMITNAYDANGHQLFPTKYVPPWSAFGEPQLSLGVVQEAPEYKDIYADNKMTMKLTWTGP